MGFPDGSAGKNPPANAGDTGSISGSEGSPGEGNRNPLQYSCLGNSIDRGPIEHRVAKSLSDFHFSFYLIKQTPSFFSLPEAFTVLISS